MSLCYIYEMCAYLKSSLLSTIPYFCFINSRNSGNSIVPFPSRSASIIKFRTSSSVGFSPIALITPSNSEALIAPLPSLIKFLIISLFVSVRSKPYQTHQRLPLVLYFLTDPDPFQNLCNLKSKYLDHLHSAVTQPTPPQLHGYLECPVQ